MQGAEDDINHFQGLLAATIFSTALQQKLFVYYDGEVVADLLSGNGEVWLFSKEDNTAYYWKGAFTAGFAVRDQCSATNFPPEWNLLQDLNLGLQINLLSAGRCVFLSEFTPETRFIVTLLEQRERLLQPRPSLRYAFQRMSIESDTEIMTDDSAAVTPTTTPERTQYYARQPNLKSASVLSV